MSVADIVHRLDGLTGARRVAYLACPFCEANGKRDKKRSLAVWTKSGYFKCYRCEEHGRIPDLEAASLVPREDAEPDKIYLPTGFYRLDQVWDSISFEDAVAYAVKRGITKELAVDLNIGATMEGPAHHRIIAPIYDSDHTVVGWIGRDWSGQQIRPYLYAKGMRRQGMFFNSSALRRSTRVPLLVVEGWLDTVPHLPNAVAVLGMPTDEQIAELAKCDRPIVHVLDGDAWREAQRRTLELRVFWRAQAGFVKLAPELDPDEIPNEDLMEQAIESLYDPIL